jgi:glycosidase
MAEMVPSEFWSYSISAIKAKYPETQFIAEIYNPGSYRKYLGSGFDYLYDKVGLYDTLKDIVKGFKPASEITSCWQTLSDIQDSMLNFLENHDEQRVASPFFAGNPAKALPALAAGLLLNRAPYMIYSGQELGEPGMDSEGFSNCDGRTSIFDYWSVKTIRDWFKGEYDKKIRDSYSFLLNLSLSEKAFSLGDTFDLQYANTDNSSYCSGNLYSFIRKFQNELIIVVVNFSSSDFSVKLNIPKHLFEYFDIKDGNECQSFDLQTGKRENLVFSSEIQFETFVPECSYSLVKLLLQ